MSGSVRILVTCKTCREPFLSALSRLGEVIPSPFRTTRTLTVQELVDSLRGVDFVVAGTDPFTGEVIRAGASAGLRMIARFGIGLDNVNLKAATESRVIVTHTPRASTDSVAEFAVALTFALLRRIPEADSATKRGEWPMATLRGTEVKEKTIGVIGFGAIGRRVAEVMSGLGARVVAYDPYVTGDPCLTSLDSLLSQSDVVTIHAALNANTEHLLGEKQFGIMKKGSVIVNTARGPIVDEKALYRALERKDIAGAALDVLESEPPNGIHPLTKLQNVILTPHIAGNTEQATERIGQDLLADIQRVMEGKAPRFPANPEVIPLIGLTPASEP